MEHLAEEFVVVTRTEDPEKIFCYSPGIVRLKSGRIIATMDFGGPGANRLENWCHRNESKEFYNAGRVFASDDDGKTWQQVATAPMLCMRPFVAGKSLYVIGFCKDLGIIRSDDDGETWSEYKELTTGGFWHQAPSNVWYEEDRLYLVMERMTHRKENWPVCSIAPVLMRANVNDDLTAAENWTFASELPFDMHVNEAEFTDFGAPFYPDVQYGYFAGVTSGWLESNVVRLKNEDDWFYDPEGKTLHLIMRAWTGLNWTGAMAKVIEHDDGSMETMFEHAPSGKRMVFINIPGGGQSKFHILYDDKTKTYWLITNQFIDGMVNFNKMTNKDRIGYDRSRLVLYYSHNCFDWLFAGVIASGKTYKEARSYASACIDGDDMLVLSRSGDKNTRNGHDTNMITFHKIHNFRSLIDTDYDAYRYHIPKES